MTWWRQAAGSFFCLFCRKESEVEFITHNFFTVSQAAIRLHLGLTMKWRNRIHSKNVE